VVAIGHTLERDDAVLGLADGSTVRASVVGRDGGTDLALLKAEASARAHGILTFEKNSYWR